MTGVQGQAAGPGSGRRSRVRPQAAGPRSGRGSRSRVRPRVKVQGQARVQGQAAGPGSGRRPQVQGQAAGRRSRVRPQAAGPGPGGRSRVSPRLVTFADRAPWSVLQRPTEAGRTGASACDGGRANRSFRDEPGDGERRPVEQGPSVIAPAQGAQGRSKPSRHVDACPTCRKRLGGTGADDMPSGRTACRRLAGPVACGDSAASRRYRHALTPWPHRPRHVRPCVHPHPERRAHSPLWSGSRFHPFSTIRHGSKRPTLGGVVQGQAEGRGSRFRPRAAGPGSGRRAPGPGSGRRPRVQGPGSGRKARVQGPGSGRRPLVRGPGSRVQGPGSGRHAAGPGPHSSAAPLPPPRLRGRTLSTNW